MTETVVTRKSDIEAFALWYSAATEIEIRPVASLEPAPGLCLVRSLASGVSRGTESTVFSGRVPQSEWQRMRAPHQEGAFPFPVKYGYACTGLVETGPDELVGQRVFGLFPHQTHFLAAPDQLHVLPDDIPVERAVLAANMETALNSLWDGLPSPGDHICVVGGGVVGLLTAYLAARIPAANVTVVDTNPGRRYLAEALGAAFAQPDEAPGNQDLVFHASSTSAGLQTAITAAGTEATIIEMSWYGTRPVELTLGADFHARRLTLKSSQVGTLPERRRQRWDFRRRLALALSLLDDPVLDILISHRIPFHQGPERLPDLLNGKADALMPVLIYS
ncbi:zinc-dependent alcohol dehydrogenase [Roseibium sp.]|uniref:zinc-dependent alcohol dehydrogenase n=1 Tax=Roseibium sp. TaxID=1936156 RepID=UPI003A97C75A